VCECVCVCVCVGERVSKCVRERDSVCQRPDVVLLHAPHQTSEFQNLAHSTQSRPDSGLGFQVKVHAASNQRILERDVSL